jgi:hypothetical protein
MTMKDPQDEKEMPQSFIDRAKELIFAEKLEDSDCGDDLAHQFDIGTFDDEIMERAEALAEEARERAEDLQAQRWPGEYDGEARAIGSAHSRGE